MRKNSKPLLPMFFVKHFSHFGDSMGGNEGNLYEKLVEAAAKVGNPYALAAVCATLVIILSLGAIYVFVFVENITVSVIVAVVLIAAMTCVLVIGLEALRIILSPKAHPITPEPTTTKPPNVSATPTTPAAVSPGDLPHDLRVDADVASKIERPLKKLGFEVEFDKVRTTFYGDYWYSCATKGNVKIGMVSLSKALFGEDNEELWMLRRWYTRILGIMEKGITHLAVFSPCTHVCDTAYLEADNIMSFDRIRVAVFMKRHIAQISQLDDNTIAKMISVKLHLLNLMDAHGI